eukprot:comp11020_c0_seq1/m.5570 comp11020_c0_seq1/g.5570  ORF comp11020_c0_seq1/g.5570 comp11020_c0_seq1/m.5570 type:complete len:219 (-) comp11020_c0_seq1:54-710(-)
MALSLRFRLFPLLLFLLAFTFLAWADMDSTDSTDTSTEPADVTICRDDLNLLKSELRSLKRSVGLVEAILSIAESAAESKQRGVEFQGPPPPIVNISSPVELRDLIAQSARNKTKVVVEYMAKWNSLSFRLEPVFEDLRILYPGIQFAKVDCDDYKLQEPVLAKAACGTLPTVYMYAAGNRLDTVLTGPGEDQLRTRMELFSNMALADAKVTAARRSV